jgi:putative endonuclease
VFSIYDQFPKLDVAGSIPVPRSISTAWFTYALRSLKDSGLYIGMTGDVERRVREHNAGYNRSTRSRAPFNLIYVKEFPSRREARQHEKFLKQGRGREMLRRSTTP